MLTQVPEFPWPPNTNCTTSYNATPSGVRLNASGMRIGQVFNIPQSANGQSIQKIGWRSANVTTSETLRIGLYTTSSGIPTSTAYGGSAYVTRATIATGTFYEETLSTPALVAAGDEVALMFEPDSYVAMSLYVATMTQSYQTYPGNVTYTPSTWSPGGNTIPYYLKTISGTYLPVSVFAPSGTGSASITSATSTTEEGNSFVVPFGCRVVGIWTSHGCQNQSAAFSLNLYSGIGGALLGSQSVLGGNQKWTSGSSPSLPQLVYLAAPVLLSAGQKVTVTVKPTSTNNVQLGYWTLNAAGEETAYRWPLGGTWMAKTSGTWTATATQLGRIGLIIDQVDDGRRLRGRRGN